MKDFISLNEEVRDFLNDLHELPIEASNEWWKRNAGRIAFAAENPKIREVAESYLCGNIDAYEAGRSFTNIISSNQSAKKDEIFLDEKDEFFVEAAKDFVMSEIKFLKHLSKSIPSLSKVLQENVSNSLYDKLNWVMKIRNHLTDYVNLNTN
jgi:hypothetical protein